MRRAEAGNQLGVAAGPLDGAEPIPVGPLPTTALVSLIRQRAALEPGLAEQLAQAAHGNPEFAIACLAAWVESGVLIPGPNGLRLSGNTPPRLPNDTHTLWSARLRALLGNNWQALAERAIRGPKGYGTPLGLPAMVDAGLYTEQANHWEFRVSAVPATLIRMAEEAGIAPQIHARCASSLEAQNDPPYPLGLAVKIAQHHLAAQTPKDAEKALLAMAPGRLDSSNAHALNTVLNALPKTPPLSVLRALAAYTLGRNQQAQSLLESVTEDDLTPWPHLHFEHGHVITADANGDFAISMTAGAAVAQVSANGFVTTTLTRAGEVYQGELPHLSYWNADIQSETACVTGLVLDAESGEPMAGVLRS